MTFRHIYHKLLVLFSLAITLSVLLVLALTVWLQTHLIRDEWRNSLQAQASLVANNSQAAIEFQDPREGRRLLRSLENNPAILQASFYIDANHILFARYRSPELDENLQFNDAPPRPGEHFRFSDKRLLVWASIPGNSNDARLEIISSLAPMHQAIRETASKTALYLSALLIALLALAYQAARRLASPLQELSSLTTEMAQNPQLAKRFRVRGDDELALLGSSFNHMIDSLQARDRELESYRLDLEELVERRTRELVIAVNDANEASQAKSDFLARMSHEIRTPMNAIVGLGQLLLKSGLNERQRQQQEQVLSASNMLLALINDILDYSRIEAGKLEIEQIPFSLEQVLHDVTSQLALRAQQRGLELLQYQAADIPGQVLGDPLRLRQVLINLINNSIKFTAQGEVIVRVKRVSLPDSNRDWLRFSVQDTGMGIPEDKQKLLFTPFTQVDDSITRRFGGSGLGLAICHQLVGLMGGLIRVYSQPGIGSLFTFDIPCCESGERRQHWLPEPVLHQQRILVIDDNASARAILQAMLTDLGMRSQTAASGKQGLQILQQASAAGDPFRLVLLDWLMPGMDGIETARHMQEMLQEQVTTILMVTAGSYEKLDGLTENSGLQHILTKPVSRSMLQDSLLECLGHRGGSLPDGQLDSHARYDFSLIRHARILLVDDVELNRLVALALLEETGVQVDTAENGLQAVTMAEENDYDLVLMDIQMPEMDGLTATREIRKRPWLQQLPILAMTAHVREPDREQSLAAGMNEHLAKPVDQDELYRALFKWIPHQSPDPHIAQQEQPAAASSLPELPELDTAKGLAHCMNRPDLYLRILSGFPAEFGASTESINAAITREEWELARRLAHSLKSAAATMGADSLAGLAQAIELQLAEQQQPDATLLNDMDTQLQLLCRQLQAIGPTAATKPAAASCRDSMLQLLEQLHQLLEKDDAEALAVFESLRTSLAATPAAAAILEELQHQIEDIEYGAALALLPGLQQLLQENPA